MCFKTELRFAAEVPPAGPVTIQCCASTPVFTAKHTKSLWALKRMFTGQPDLIPDWRVHVSWWATGHCCASSRRTATEAAAGHKAAAAKEHISRAFALRLQQSQQRPQLRGPAAVNQRCTVKCKNRHLSHGQSQPYSSKIPVPYKQDSCPLQGLAVARDLLFVGGGELALEYLQVPAEARFLQLLGETVLRFQVLARSVLRPAHL